jgi:hypothetical protein
MVCSQTLPDDNPAGETQHARAARRCGPQRGEPKEGRQVAAPPRGVNRSQPPRLPQINLTERLFVVSVSVADVNWTVIGGLQLGEKVAVTEIV